MRVAPSHEPLMACCSTALVTKDPPATPSPCRRSLRRLKARWFSWSEHSHADKQLEVTPLPQRSSSTRIESKDLTLPSLDEYERAVAVLSRIDQVRVRHLIKVDGHAQYVVDVFLRSRNSWTSDELAQISDDALRKLLLAEREPDYDVQHRFYEFVELRNSLQAMLKKCHGCAACSELKELVLPHGHMSSSVLTLGGLTEASRLRASSEFLAALVRVYAKENLPGNHYCPVRMRAAVAVARFLHRQPVVSFGLM